MSNSQSEIIPYVIMVSYPGSCHIHHIFSSIKKSKLNDNLLEQFVDFMYDVIDTSKLTKEQAVAIEYFNNIELIQICVMIQNEFNYPNDKIKFYPLKNTFSSI